MISTWQTDPLFVSLLILIGLACLPFLVLHPRLALGCWLAAFFSPVVHLPISGTPLPDLRSLSGLVVIALALRALLRVSQAESSSTLFPFALLPLAVFSALTLIWSINPEKTRGSAQAWLVLAIGLILIGRQISSKVIYETTMRLVCGAVAASALAFAAGLPSSMAGGRARGIMSNANGLAILCSIAVPYLLTKRDWRVKALSLVPLALVFVTGSRAGALALLVGAATVTFRSMPFARRAIAAPFVVGGGYGAYVAIREFALSGQSTILVVRTNDSRLTVWREAFDQFERNRWFGVGFGALPTESGSSWLKILSEGGIVGATAALVLTATALWASRRSIAGFAILMAGVVDATFEGWLFTAGSIYAVIFYLVATGSTTTSQSRENAPGLVGPEQARLRVHREVTAPGRDDPARRSSASVRSSPRGRCPT